MYPNPASDYIGISSDENIEKILISNTFGQLVYELEIQSNSSRIDVSFLENGLYLISIFSDKGVVTEKFIINK